MAFKIVWSKEAEDTFEEIISYLEIKWTEKEIEKFVSETSKIVSILKKNPFLFRGSDKAKIFEVLIGKQNLLIYQINESEKRVELLSFWDTRQNPRSKFIKSK
jgi:plasmid stabilization system protein ParE